MTVAHDQLAFQRAVGKNQLRIAFQFVEHREHILPRLFLRIEHMLDALVGQDRRVLLVDAVDGIELPVLDLQHQQAPARMKHHEVRVLGALADGDVVPAQVVVFQFVVQAVGKPLFTGCYSGYA